MIDRNQPELVIMAAGMGSRYGGLKQIDPVDRAGHTIIDYSIYDAMRAGFRKFTFIIKREIEKDFKEVMEPHLLGRDIEVQYVYQELDCLPEGFTAPEGRKKPYGTAHAIACCLGKVTAPFAVINADDYYGAHAFEEIYRFLERTTDGGLYHYAMLGYRLENTVSESGTVARGICQEENGLLSEIVEHTKIALRDGKIVSLCENGEIELLPDSIVSMNLWAFTPSLIREASERMSAFLTDVLPENPIKKEFYLPVLVEQLLNEKKADVTVLKSTDQWQGVTYREDKEKVVSAFRKLIEDGVYPETF